MLKLLFLMFLIALPMNTKAKQNQFAVFGYLPEWRYHSADIEHVCRYTTHLILFSLEIDPKGEIAALDRFPSSSLFQEMQKTCKTHETKLLICFGGHSRSKGFSSMVLNKSLRQNFLKQLFSFLLEKGLDGVDYNWEYPRTREEWRGLFELIKETRLLFDSTPRSQSFLITVDYYPDSFQEKVFAQSDALEFIDYLHMMAYDQSGKHSTREFAEKSVQQAINLGLPREKITLGVPFYARHMTNGEAKTYSDIVHGNEKLEPAIDIVEQYFFNGIDTITYKTKYAIQNNIGGLMIWEVGQDLQYSRDQLQEKSLLKTIFKSLADEEINQINNNGKITDL